MASKRSKQQDQKRMAKAELKNPVAGKVTQRKVLQAAATAATSAFDHIICDIGGQRMWNRLCNEAARNDMDTLEYALTTLLKK